MFTNPIFWLVVAGLFFLRELTDGAREERGPVKGLSEEGCEEFHALKTSVSGWSVDDADRELSDRIEAAARAKGIRVDV